PPLPSFPTRRSSDLQYMSPEQIDARPLSPRSDLYALGLVMWELLAGHPPFVAESPRVLLDKLCTEPAPQLPAEARRGLPRGVEQDRKSTRLNSSHVK